MENFPVQVFYFKTLGLHKILVIMPMMNIRAALYWSVPGQFDLTSFAYCANLILGGL